MGFTNEMKFITSAVSDILKEISQVAESEIERELINVCYSAIEKNKDRIISEVKKKHLVACHTTLLHSMDSNGMHLEFSFKPKSEPLK